MAYNKRLSREILSTLRTVDYSTPTGVYLGTGYEVETDRRELDPLILKMAKCLHYHHFGFVIPETATELVTWNISQEFLSWIQPDLIGGFVGAKEHFAYGYNISSEYAEDNQKYGSAFQFIFYQRCAVTVFFVSNDVEQDAGSQH